jgi:hypothetical protein
MAFTLNSCLGTSTSAPAATAVAAWQVPETRQPVEPLSGTNHEGWKTSEDVAWSRRALKALSCPPSTPTMNNDQLSEPPTTQGGQRSVSVSHEDLRSRVGVVTPSVPEVFALSVHATLTTTSVGTTASGRAWTSRP